MKNAPIRKAMLLCAGLGTRMRPLTDHKPKPLVTLAGKTLLDHALDWFAQGGVQNVVINTHYKAGMIEEHLRERITPHISLSYEPELLETGGGIVKALPMLGDAPFFSANCDALCLYGKTPALKRLHNAWDEGQMDALLLVVPLEKASGYEGRGDFFVDKAGSIKRRGESPSAPYIFSGVQILHPRLFENAPAGAFSINLLYNRDIAADGSLHRIKALVHDGAWLHVGDPKALEQAEKFLVA